LDGGIGREIGRVFAGEENPHREWVMKCLENPHSLSIPIVSHDYLGGIQIYRHHKQRN
jgi:hypothetical protein